MHIEEIEYDTESSNYFSAVRDLQWPIWLDSGYPGQSRGRFDVISASPFQKIVEHSGKFILLGANDEKLADYEVPWLAMSDALQGLGEIECDLDIPFKGGLLGYLAYELTDRKSQRRGNCSAVPRMQMGAYQWALVQDHELKKATIIGLPQLTQNEFEIITSMVQCHTPAERAEFSLNNKFRSAPKKHYMDMIDKVKDYLVSGDCYQVNISKRFVAPYEGDVYQAYTKVRKALPSQYSCFFQPDDVAILSFSPESLVASHNGFVRSKPIKGTIARGESSSQDEEAIVRLKQSVKDQAENVMIVDLIRNDLGKVCEPFTVKVPKLLDVETYANVHHLVSTVCGQLKPQYSNIDLLSACFPGGSITGAPKKRVMEIIRELEAYDRNIYCGSLGYLSVDGQMEMNIAIRSMMAFEQEIYCWGGGGIVADSEALSEYSEIMSKISILLETVSDI